MTETLGFEGPRRLMLLCLGNLAEETVLKEEKNLVRVLLALSKKAITRKQYTQRQRVDTEDVQ